jgi:hypothetical protein
MLLAETAILVHFKTVGVIFLVLERIVVALLAILASKSDLCTHKTAPPIKLYLPQTKTAQSLRSKFRLTLLFTLKRHEAFPAVNTKARRNLYTQIFVCF